jgi:ankyrin repeat protein
MEAGAAVEARVHQCTPLFIAAANGHAKLCGVLMEAGATIEARNGQQHTPLHAAAQEGHIQVCRILIEAGAAVEARNKYQSTPLHRAAISGHDHLCRMLIEAGATLDARNGQQHTPLHVAALKGHAEACRVLMKAGAAVDARTDIQNTPLHLAASGGYTEVCRILTVAKAAVDARNGGQCTPLHLAALQGHNGTCTLLTYKGADLATRASTNRTPAQIAQHKGHAALAAHLRNSNGAHCLRCTGPSLEPRLLWNDTPQPQQDAMLDEMQAQWLARVVEGCAHARVGLTLRGAFGGGLSTGMLVHVMGYVFGGTQSHLKSCISTGRVAAVTRLPKPMAKLVAKIAAAVDVEGAVSAQSDGAVPAAKRAKVGGTGGGGPMQELAQRNLEQMPPKLALVSHALALATTPPPQLAPARPP